MSTPVHPLLAAVRELEQRDGELAARIEELTQLEAEIAELRAEAERVVRARDELPARRDRATQELREAQLEVARRHTALEDAKARAARVRSERERLEQEAAAAEAAAARLLECARVTAERTGGVVADDVEQWAARARAAVFAERTHAEGERQRVQAEATELGASVTGDAFVGDVPRVRSAVEAALRE